MNKPTFYRAAAAAVLAAPFGWILAGVLGALARDYYSTLAHRPLYLPGPHLEAAAAAALIAAAAVVLWQLGKR